MKSVKYTLAALAVIALASVGAKAQSTGAPGQIVLGVFNTTNSLQYDLGTYSSLSNGESWDLGNVTSLAGSSLVFSLAASAQSNTTAAGGLLKGQIALAGINIPSSIGTLTSEINAISTAEESVIGTPVAGSNGHTGYFSNLLQSSNTSYAQQDGRQGFGFGSNNDIDQNWTGNDSATLYTLVKSGTPTQVGVFSTLTTGGDTILTFNTNSVAVPEPSTYALGLCALALLAVLKRRSKVA